MKRLFVLCLCLLSVPAWASWDMDQLMQGLSRNKLTRATFVETKYIAMLTGPVSSSGELLFVAPDRLERRTLQPRAETMVLQGDTMTLSRGQRQTVLKLQDYPAVGVLTESIRATLAGDRAALERHYTAKLGGSEANWSLVLVPKEGRVRGIVTEIRIGGERGEVRTVQVEQSDKDYSIMTIQKLASP